MRQPWDSRYIPDQDRKFLQACELCLVLDQDVILFRKTVDLTFQLFVFLKHVLFITKIVFYISKYIADTGDPFSKGTIRKPATS